MNKEILVLADKHHLAADDLRQEAETVETCGGYLHMSLMGYSPEALREAADEMENADELEEKKAEEERTLQEEDIALVDAEEKARERDALFYATMTVLRSLGDLSAEECRAIFRHIQGQKSVYAGRLFTETDIRLFCEEYYAFTPAEETIREIAEKGKSFLGLLEDLTADDTSYIQSAVEAAVEAVKVSDIVWDIDMEQAETLPDLPEEVIIPMEELRGQDIADYLSDKYQFMVEAYTVREVLKA